MTAVCVGGYGPPYIPTQKGAHMRLVVNVHLKEGLPPDKNAYLDALEDVAEDLLRAFQNIDARNYYLTSVAVQPAPKPLLHTRDL
jgi:hypothetical protein